MDSAAQPVRILAGEPLPSAPLPPPAITPGEACARALLDRPQWKSSDFSVLAQAMLRVKEALDQALKAIRRRAQAGQELGQGEAWILENRRLLMAVAKDLTRSFKESRKTRKRGSDTDLICIDAARSFLQAVSFAFDKQSLGAYFQAAQQGQPWATYELWALKPALQFVILERLAALAAPMLETGETPDHPSPEEIRDCVSSLRAIDQADWKTHVEALSETDRILRQDPGNAYARMDFATRDRYRSAASELARCSKWHETDVAQKAVALAAEAKASPLPDPRATERRSHVGYYLVDDGRARLQRELRCRLPLGDRLRQLVLRSPAGWYLGSIELTTIAVILLVMSAGPDLEPLWLTALLLLLPATEAALGLVNRLATTLFRPRVLPKMDFSEGIPADCSTLVVVPTLLLNDKQVEDMVEQLEIRYLANRQANLAFGLVTDTPDAAEQFDEKDPLAQLCAERIEALNLRYGPDNQGSFYLFHRARQYNPSEHVWMGWERKRGKLIELNRFLLGKSDPFPLKTGDMQWLRRIRYVITLDSDTQLPKDAAHRLIGTLAHPLNRPVVDPRTNTVTEGYGIIQPRIGISVHSATRSRLAAIFSGETGFDIYTRAVSETYQDLFGEGSFTGKGAYELETFEAVLDQRFPTNVLLSHDLIEGTHARSGLVSDIELIDDYPSHFSAYNRRKHRWIRGDWQIMRWTLPKVPDVEWRLIPNPLSTISRWKIFDNLRRSMFDPSILVLLLCGWLFLPGSPLFWTVAVLVLLLLPGYFELALAAVKTPFASRRKALWRGTAEGFVTNQLHVFFFLAFLPHQTLVILDAVARTMRRMWVTRQKMLEWETAAEAEIGARKRTPVDRYLDANVWVAVAIACLLLVVRPESLMVAGPVLLLWGLLKPMCEWLNSQPTSSRRAAVRQDSTFLRDTALRTWRFFRDHSGPAENWLAPDSVQQDPALVGHKVSPTNLGLLLNARLAALEMGYSTLPETLREITATMATMQRLRRHHGHLLNWYDSQTLAPLPPFFISTVDNGNLAGCLWALKQGLLEFTKRSAIVSGVWRGLEDHIRLLEESAALEGVEPPESDRIAGLQNRAAGWRRFPESRMPSLDKMIPVLHGLEARLAGGPPRPETLYWIRETARRMRAVREAAHTMAPWLLPEVQLELRAANLELPAGFVDMPLDRISAFAASFAALAQKRGASRELVLCLIASGNAAAALVEDAERLAADADRFVREMDFGLLFDRQRKLLTVGFNVETGQLAPSCYDLLASEARMAALVAVAKGDVPQESWFRLGRGHVLYKNECVLASWTGTLFEYLMPLLWMRSYPNTVLDKSAVAAVNAQRRAAHDQATPWGVSEAAYGSRDAGGFYQYHAFGLPGLALRELRALEGSAAWTAAPYASFLALSVEPAAAIANLRLMQESGWCKLYGFYDSVEFDGPLETGRPVRTWMAHHQGMSLLAICNTSHRNAFVRWFHAEPSIAAVELLLHERVPRSMTVEPVEEPVAA
jgi:hypothetical protein